MKNRGRASLPAQVDVGLSFTARQLLLSMLEARHRPQPLRVVQLGSFIRSASTLPQELFATDAVELVGPSALHRTERSHC
jgi:hypothetical protein